MKSGTPPAGWVEDDGLHRCERCGTTPISFNGMSVYAAAELVMASLSREDIKYAADPSRGEYRGFAALHDIMDANMILPFAEDDSLDDAGRTDEYVLFANAVSDEVSRRILNA